MANMELKDPHVCDENCEKDCCLEHEDEDEYYEEYEDYESGDKWRYSLYSALVFLVIANPYTYSLVNGLLGKFVKIANNNGCPTMKGLFIHAVVFTLIIRAMMEFDI